MKFSWLSRDKDGEGIQAFPLRNGFVNLITNAVVSTPRIIVCVAEGAFVITWNDATTATIDMLVGDSYTIDGAISLTISSGKFHIVGKTVA